MIRWACDLEMNQLPDKTSPIIQIGAVLFDDSGVLDTFSRYIKQDTPVTEYITKLTGITNDDVDGGCTLLEAHMDLIAFTADCDSLQAVVWGDGDMRTLREQLPEGAPWPYGRRIMDVKSIAQFFAPVMGFNGSGGLSKTMNRYGMSFSGRKHSADADARNTALLYNKFKELVRSRK